MRCVIKTKMGSTFQHMLVRFKIYHLNTLLLLMELNCSHCFIQYDLHHKTHNGRTDYKLVVLSHCVTLVFWGSICYSFFFWPSSLGHPTGIRIMWYEQSSSPVSVWEWISGELPNRSNLIYAMFFSWFRFRDVMNGRWPLTPTLIHTQFFVTLFIDL